MHWRKLGLVFCANKQNMYMQKAGHAPVPMHLYDDIYRIFFGAYDDMGRSRIFSLEIDIMHPNKILYLKMDPLISIGDMGYYDDNGILPSYIVINNNNTYIYTIGFSVKNKIMFDAAIGLAISDDSGLTFSKLKGPVLDRSPYDPCFSTSPCVLYVNGVWHMWYVSGERWEMKNMQLCHFYNIKHRTSRDGIYWNNDVTTSIDFANEFEYAIARPSVIFQDDLFYMWYCFRAQQDIATYRIGYAESKDGVRWTRMDEKMRSLDVSESGWDSEMICYPFVFDHKGRRYMLYNGNGYGKTGFGLAVLENA